MQLREIKDLSVMDDDNYYITPKDYGYYALLIAIIKNKSCKQAFKQLDKELEKRECSFHNTYSRGW